MFIYYLTIRKKPINPCIFRHLKPEGYKNYYTWLCPRCGKSVVNKKHQANKPVVFNRDTFDKPIKKLFN